MGRDGRGLRLHDRPFQAPHSTTLLLIFLILLLVLILLIRLVLLVLVVLLILLTLLTILTIGVRKSAGNSLGGGRGDAGMQTVQLGQLGYTDLHLVAINRLAQWEPRTRRQ